MHQQTPPELHQVESFDWNISPLWITDSEIKLISINVSIYFKFSIKHWCNFDNNNDISISIDAKWHSSSSSSWYCYILMYEVFNNLRPSNLKVQNGNETVSFKTLDSSEKWQVKHYVFHVYYLTKRKKIRLQNNPQTNHQLQSYPVSNNGNPFFVAQRWH